MGTTALDVLNEAGHLIHFRNPSRSAIIPEAGVDVEHENGTASGGVGVSQLPLDVLKQGRSPVSTQETLYSSVRIPEAWVNVEHENGTSSGGLEFSQRLLDALIKAGRLIYFRRTLKFLYCLRGWVGMEHETSSPPEVLSPLDYL